MASKTLLNVARRETGLHDIGRARLLPGFGIGIKMAFSRTTIGNRKFLILSWLFES